MICLTGALALPAALNQSTQSKLLPCPRKLKPLSTHGLNPLAIRLRATGPWTWGTTKGKSSN